jgi:hypothetical protein
MSSSGAKFAFPVSSSGVVGVFDVDTDKAFPSLWDNCDPVKDTFSLEEVELARDRGSEVGESVRADAEPFLSFHGVTQPCGDPFVEG